VSGESHEEVQMKKIEGRANERLIKETTQ